MTRLAIYPPPQQSLSLFPTSTSCLCCAVPRVCSLLPARMMHSTASQQASASCRSHWSMGCSCSCGNRHLTWLTLTGLGPLPGTPGCQGGCAAKLGCIIDNRAPRLRRYDCIFLHRRRPAASTLPCEIGPSPRAAPHPLYCRCLAPSYPREIRRRRITGSLGRPLRRSVPCSAAQCRAVPASAVPFFFISISHSVLVLPGLARCDRGTNVYLRWRCAALYGRRYTSYVVPRLCLPSHDRPCPSLPRTRPAHDPITTSAEEPWRH